MNSIHRHLLVWQLVALLLTGLVSTLVAYGVAWETFNRQRDDGLVQIAYSIVRHGTTDATPDTTAPSQDNSADDADHGDFVSQIWDEHGLLVYSSIPNGGPPRQTPGTHTFDWRNQSWHSFTLQDAGLTIQVANTDKRRSDVFRTLSVYVWMPLGVMIALLAAAIWWLVRRALTPLQTLQHDLSQRQASDMRSLSLPNPPDELIPVIDALNGLLGRVQSAMHAQQRFIADAAHELRTPLTALRLQAQVLSDETDPSVRSKLVQELLAGVARASRLIDQLLNAAKLDAQQVPHSPVDLVALSQEVLISLAPMIDAKKLIWGLDAPDTAWIQGDVDSLRTLLNNLIDNAVRYAPSGGHVSVGIATKGQALTLTVDDNGPGIEPALRERALDRFFRLRPGVGEGSGLGLSIVQQIATQHGAQLALDTSPLGGLRVSISWPLTTTGETSR